MGATAIAGGSKGRLFPEWPPDESELRGKGLPGEHWAGSGYITYQETITWNWLIRLWYERLCWVGVGGSA